MRENLRKHLAFIVFFCIYAGLGYLNLDTLPVAWTDEVLNLDPAVQFVENGAYTSKLWPNKGANIHFASYLPGIQWFQTVYLYFLPIEIFWVRLPFFLINLGSIILIYRYLIKNTALNPFWITLISAVIFLDKSVFELMRSMRVEPVIIFGVSILLNLSKKRSLYFLKALIIGYLSMCHVYVWPFLAFWFIYDWIRLNTAKKVLYILICLLPLFLFWSTTGYNASNILTQMGFHAQQHTVVQSDLPHNPLLNSLWYRFYPYYLEQALNPFIFLGLFLIILMLSLKHKAWKNLNYGIHLAWITGMIFLFGIMSPQYRYLPVFWIVGIVLVVTSKRINLTHRIFRYGIVFIVLNASFSFLGRHTAAILQSRARDAEAVHDFLRKELKTQEPDTKLLLLGESIGFYHAHRGRNAHNYDYGVDFYPQHFNWNNYDYIYLLSHEERPQDMLIATYQSNKEALPIPKFMEKFAKGGTYDGMKVYQLKP